MLDALQALNWQIIAPFLIIQIILMIIALVDLWKADKVNGPKWMWALIIVIINIVGPVVYLIIGRREF
ncbi:MAG TPA: PLD nuclease N-terminal domain-containing protein [Bacillota bacterium]|nr:PLD nuclease N-terminal domain-containing protein [Bacillota bacterium]